MKKILVIREFDEFSRILAEKGFEIVNLPTVETKPLDDLSDLHAKLDHSAKYDGIFLTSRHAAQILAKSLREKERDFRGKIYVLGKRSFDILQTENLDSVFFETANTASEMLRQISSEELKNKRFLFIRGEKSLRIVPEYLEKFSDIDETIVYETKKISLAIDKIKNIRKRFEQKEFLCACFFSPSGAESFLEQFDSELLHQIKIATIGKTTADFIEKQNLPVDFVSSKAAAKDFAFELIEYLKTKTKGARVNKGDF